MTSAKSGQDEVDARLDLIEDTVAIGPVQLQLLRPLDASSLVSETQFAENEFLPYWAEIWPSALRLATHLDSALAGQSVLELGCGIGIPSLVAAFFGAKVIATDWAADAIALLSRNAERNSLALEVARVDWSDPTALVERAPYDLILASDVLYEERNVGWLVDLLPRLSNRALLADPGRKHAASFFEAIAVDFTREELDGGVHLLERRGIAEGA
jgi:predicted nicotinamide N-methyase